MRTRGADLPHVDILGVRVTATRRDEAVRRVAELGKYAVNNPTFLALAFLQATRLKRFHDDTTAT